LFQITLGITEIVEEQVVDGITDRSADGVVWAANPVAAVPQKLNQYTAPVVVVDNSSAPSVRCLRVRWQVNRWGRAL